jgi:acetylornithine deacetylase/succinyl-diaminopimelate desuccinylase-like protein
MKISPHLADLFEFLRFPTVSAQPKHAPDMEACAVWLEKKFGSMGLTSQVMPTGGHPAVIAQNKHVAGRRTILIYGHYDVQPPEPLELWDHPPFEPHVENGIIYARGSTDNKGQILAHILGVQETLSRGEEIGVNLTFLVEGEEEVGSSHLADFLEKNRDLLKCDVVVISDTGMIAAGVPTFTYGLRGITCLEVKVKGPSHDLHSGIFGGPVANPAMVLARLLATVHDADGRILVEGFYDTVKGLEDWERKAWAALPTDDMELLELSGAPKLAPEKGYTAVEAIWGRPTIEINGIAGGYQGPGSKTVLPSEAYVKLSCRLVPDQDPAEALEKVKAHFRKHCPPTVTLELTDQHGGWPYYTDPHGLFGKAAQKALKETFPGRDVALIREGGSIPIVADFKRILGIDTVLLGLALPDCRAHSPNENFPIENFEAGIRLNQNLLRELATT